MASMTSCENTLYKLHGSMAKTQISDLHNASLPRKLSRYPPNASASPFVPFVRAVTLADIPEMESLLVGQSEKQRTFGSPVKEGFYETP